MRVTPGLAAVAVFTITASVASAQPPGPRAGAPGQPPAPSNLQILPKDMPREQLIPLMQNISAALGVQCNYCHVQEGRGGRNDMASDEKPMKKTAREMMRLVGDIRQKLPQAVGKTPEATAQVGCVTCHRGVAIPRQLADILTETAKAKGNDAAIAQFRELRTRYYGAQAYDFSENGLIAVAQRATTATTADDALAWLNLNLEFYPKSSRTYQAMAQVHQRKNDKDGAIKDLEKAVELDPNNNQAKAQLQQLKGQ